MQADGTPDSKQAFQRWREAMTFAELCALAADFLWGELPAFPGWMASDIDEETDELVPFLSAACERGFLPTASQPGACPELAHDGQPRAQRAFVIGFALPEFLDELQSRVQGTDLVLASYSACKGFAQPDHPVAKRGAEPYLFVGADHRIAELEIFAPYLSPQALEAIGTCDYVCLIDPEWGRDALLWPILAPQPDLPS